MKASGERHRFADLLDSDHPHQCGSVLVWLSPLDNHL